MSGAERRNDEKDTKEGEGAGGGWASTFLKVAGAVAATAAAVVAVAAVASSSQSVLKQPEVAPFQARRPDYLEEVILNVDGSLLREREVPSAGCGGVLSDSSGKWLCGFAQKLNPNLKVDETEKEAILRGLLWVKEKGKRKILVKSDNEGVVYSVNCGRRSNDPLVCGIRDLLKSPHWEATLTCIHGRSNAVADRLAHKAHSFTSFDLCQFDYLPENCTSLQIM